MAHEFIEYDTGDGSHVKIEFTKLLEGVKVVKTLDSENENPKEM